MKIVRAQYTLTEAEAVRALKELRKSRGMNYRLIPLLGIIFLLLAIADIAITGFKLNAVILAFLGVMLASVSQRTSFLAKRDFKKNPEANQMVYWTFSEEGVQVKTAVSESRFVWNVLLRVIEVKDGFLFFQQPRIAYWVPKSAFESEGEIARLVDLIENCRIKFKRP